MKTVMTLQKLEPHWTDPYIWFDETSGEYVAFDEAGLEHSRWPTSNQARDALVIYAAVGLTHTAKRPLTTCQIGETQ